MLIIYTRTSTCKYVLTLGLLKWPERGRQLLVDRRFLRKFSVNKGTQLQQQPLSGYIHLPEKTRGLVSFEYALSSKEVLPSPVTKEEGRHELQSKLETLESVGCTKDQIQESPEILLLTESEILHRVQRLRSCGVRQINVMKLKLGHIKSHDALSEKIARLQEVTAGRDTVSSTLAEKLQCNAAEWHGAKTKYIYLRHVRNVPYFANKVDYLFSLGFTVEDIKKNIVVLNKSLGCMKSRVKEVTSANIPEALTLSVLNFSDITFSRWLQTTKLEKSALGGFPNKYEAFAHLLNSTTDDIMEIPVFSKYSVHRIRTLIELLVQNGLEQDDILCHAHVLIRSSKCILAALEKLKELGFTKPTVVQMVNVINGRQVSKRQSKKKELCSLAVLLAVDVTELEPYKPLLRQTLLKGKYTLRKSVQYLQSQGFTGRDIVACPIILGHDLSVLKAYVESYNNHGDFEKLESQFQSDKPKILNWIQYLIERDINFSSQEGIAEEEEVEG